VGPVTVTSDVGTFKNAIRGLSAAGGGDCPELAIRGMLNAVDASDEGGDVFLFTDASAKDASLMGSVRSLATSKKVKMFWGLFGTTLNLVFKDVRFNSTHPCAHAI
jgi:von Willebrand factor A domain-containing protein 7